MERLNLKPAHKPVAEYYRALEKFKTRRVSHETAVRSAFQNLLDACCKQFKWQLIPEWPIKRDGRHALRVDGALVDEYRLAHGFWEAKDASDDLRREVKRKFEAGYPSGNILFQSPERAILWQNGREVADADLTDPDELVKTLARFFNYQPPAYEQWQQAVEDFQTEIPQFGDALKKLIEQERKTNPRFRQAFADFYELCRQSINPNLSEQAVEEMLIQHLLTERIFRTVFKNSDFTRRNVIAHEIEKVIDALTSQAFSREEFLRRFDHFYRAIETTAATIEDFGQKQEFLNAVYEKFFQGFSVKVADTHGIVYTPQPVVNFMVRSVEDILKQEFGKSLSARGVHILDPFVGTGNFIVRIMQEIDWAALNYKYEHELHCNEVMLLPYYIASMNIEHEYYELTGRYVPFEGICLVDTFELAEGRQAQLSFMTPENTARVERQKQSDITVVIGNPPYNVGQVNENDNNKNRKYQTIDKRISDTYAKDSKASSVSKLNNPYVKAIRWASDRIGKEGIVALITINSFVDKKAFDGMRKHLAQDFDKIYILDLGGDPKSNQKLSGTIHNIFGIPDGVSINLFVRNRKEDASQSASISYARLEEFWRKEEKFIFLEDTQSIKKVSWELVQPDEEHTWLTEGLHSDYKELVPIGNKETKRSLGQSSAIFLDYSIGVNTNRDDWAYNFNFNELSKNIEKLINTYNAEVHRWQSRPKNKVASVDLDNFVLYDDSRIKWSSRLKESLLRGSLVTLSEGNIRNAIYRPFTSQYLYFDPILNQRRGRFPSIFPTQSTEDENYVISVGGYGRKAFSVMLADRIPDLNFYADPAQCFPFYTYDEDGANRRENITDWALEKFRAEYADAGITKWDIFHYVYAVLHHPFYRERYAANLKRELPRVPFAPDFHAFARAGGRLAAIHVGYEQQPEYPLERVAQKGAKPDWRVEKMRLGKDKSSIVYNDFLTLRGIPPDAFEYALGNRSALEWVLDQYQLTTDKRSRITNDPNRADDPEYIVRLVCQVVAVSVETVGIVRALPRLGIDGEPHPNEKLLDGKKKKPRRSKG